MYDNSIPTKPLFANFDSPLAYETPAVQVTTLPLLGDDFVRTRWEFVDVYPKILEKWNSRIHVTMRSCDGHLEVVILQLTF